MRWMFGCFVVVVVGVVVVAAVVVLLSEMLSHHALVISHCRGLPAMELLVARTTVHVLQGTNPLRYVYPSSRPKS